MSEIEGPSLPPLGRADESEGGGVTGESDATSLATPVGVTLAGASEIVAGIVEVVQAELDSIEEWAEQTDDVDILMVLRSALESQRKAVAGATATTDRRLLALTKVGEVISTPGAGQLIHRSNPKRIAQGQKLARALAARVSDTPCDEDGVMLPPAELCRLTADECVIVFGLDTASTSFRTGELKKRGLAPAAFTEYEEGAGKADFMGL